MTIARNAGLALLVGTTALLAACGYTVQDSSGREFLNRDPSLLASTDTKAASRASDDMRGAIRDAANVEPRLTFPARIGIARIEGGRITAIPPDEAEAWSKMAERLGPRFGAFVPISPLIAELVASESTRTQRGGVAETVRKLRLGAARQHVDAMLVYEVAGHAKDNNSPLSVADLTIVGMFIVPSRHLKAEGFAAALLLDVRNGYPYGTANARAADANLVPNVGSTARTGDLLRSVHTAAAVKLVGEVEKMAEALYQRRTRDGAQGHRPAVTARP